MPEAIEALPPSLWFERIEMVANGELRCTESALRHALHLLQLSPPQFRPREYGSIDEASYEGLLDAGHFEAAARCLVATFTISVSVPSATGEIQAAVSNNAMSTMIHGKGISAAAAILQAWAHSLLALRSEPKLSLVKAAGEA